MLDSEHYRNIVSRALQEDIGKGDITSATTIPEKAGAVMRIVSRQPMVVCGLDVFDAVYHALGNGIRIAKKSNDGAFITANAVLAELEGNARILLTGERTALNIIQRMSGVATLTRQYVEAVKGTKAVILDTRKTMPGMRELDKYAVRTGGGQNHRMRLDDMVLIKDNHIAVGSKAWGLGLKGIIEKVREQLPSLNPQALSPIPIVVECDTLEQVKEALAAKPDRIMLDNMSTDMLQKAVAMVAGKIPLEASGGVNLQTVRAIAETGVDYISVGALTHSAHAADIGADITIRT